jgi:putative oxidoreductase
MLVPDLGTYVDWGLLALRAAVGIIFVVHGWPKMTGARGMAEAMGRPGSASVAFITVQGIVEAAGGVLLVLGIWTQLVALVFAIIMVGAIYLKNTAWKTGFMSMQATGWEFDFVLLAANLALLTLGPGAIAVLPSTVAVR